MSTAKRGRWIAVGLAGLALASTGLASCSSDRATEPSGSQGSPPLREPSRATTPLDPAALVDESESVIQRGPRVDVAYAFASRPFRDIPSAERSDEARVFRAPLRSPLPFLGEGLDRAVQTSAPLASMPPTLHDFLAQGTTLGGCIYPKPDGGEPAPCTSTGDPPDPNGAVGLSHFVQVVNGGIGIWHKDGTVAQAPKLLNTLWAGYTGTNAGNACAKQNDGDPVVLYDQLADRWFITQFSLPNSTATRETAPSFQCVAVSQTGDPTGAYWLYDFQYNVAINDYAKFGVWQDAYYAAFNDFNPNFAGVNACAYDRASMLAGRTATQHCFQQGGSSFGFMPGNVDGPIKPPDGEPGFFVTLRNGTSLSLYKFHVDWATPANSTFTGPTNLTVSAYTQLCGGGSCVPQPSPGNQLASLGDRPMFHLSYRNFGTFESLVFNHSVGAGGGGGAPRWYEIRSPDAAPSIFQQSTFAPDSSTRWMGSMSQDQAQDMALGYSISSASMVPGIAWTGRLGTDPLNQMAQAEAIVHAGVGVQTGNFSDGTTADRWGDYSNMSIDPADDCTFWYTHEIYPANGIFDWDTRIASFTFPSCAQNDFTIGVSPASQTVSPGGSTTYTVSTASTKGSAETITLVIQDLPAGVTGAFVPPTVTAGLSSTLTVTAAVAAPLTPTPDTFTVIGKATSAVHPATANVSVGVCMPLTQCPSPDNCGSMPDGCGGTLSCGGACAALDQCHVAGTCTGNVCSDPAKPDGTPCSVGTCQAGTCTAPMADAGSDAGAADAGSDSSSGPDSGRPGDAGTDSGSTTNDAGADSGSKGNDAGADSGARAEAGADSGQVPLDGSMAMDTGSEPSDDAATGGSAQPGSNGGCGCRTAGLTGPQGSWALSGLGCWRARASASAGVGVLRGAPSSRPRRW